MPTTNNREMIRRNDLDGENGLIWHKLMMVAGMIRRTCLDDVFWHIIKQSGKRSLITGIL